MKYPDLFNPDLSRVGTRESQAYNIAAARLMAETVKTSLGPRGMEKMHVDILGEETITKHGGAFLRKVDVDHPAAKAVAEAVNAVDTHVGDGTVSAAVLIGSMLGHSQDLLRMGLATAAIIRGFEAAMGFALEALESVRMASDRADRALARQLVDTCLAGKAVFGAPADRAAVRDAIVESARLVAGPAGAIDVDDVKIEEKQGVSAIQMVMGTVIDKPIDDGAMPREIRNAKVLLLNDSLEAERTKTESEIEITSPSQMGEFAARQDADAAALVKKVVDSGAGVVISRKGIGDLAREGLARAGIISIRRVKYNDLWWLEKATGARTCESVDAISAGELGLASRVCERAVGGDRMLFVEADDPRSVTLLLRAVSKRHLDEFHRTAKNALFVLRNFARSPFVVFGGGACEAAVARAVRERAAELEGAEQLAAGRFADALEEIPMTLARNVGMNTLDALPMLRSRCAGPAGRAGRYGVNSDSRKIEDMSSSGVVETSAVKEQVIKTAAEAVNMILGVDDVFMKDLIDNTHCHIDGTVHAHKDPGKNHNHWEQEGLEQRQMHHYY